jgi:hypothetical protein
MNTNPLRTLTIALIIFFSVVGLGFEVLYGYFSSNVTLNGIVVSAMFFGLGYIYVANIRLQGIVSLFKATEQLEQRANPSKTDEDEDEDYEEDDLEFDYTEEYRELMESKGQRLLWLMSAKDVENLSNWSPQNMFTHAQVELALSASRLRIAEVRNFSNYFSGILIILGLLGTFLGLLETIKAIGLVFSGDSIKFLVADKADTSGDDILKFFDAIAKPLEGMGIAFSSSLFGLSGSLIVGLFAFVSSRNQSFFLFDLFDWFKARTAPEDISSLERSTMTSLPSSQGLMGALVRGGMKLPTGQSMRALGGAPATGVAGIPGTGIGSDGGGGIGGEFRGKFKGEFRGDGNIEGNLDADALTGVLNRLEGLSRDAIEKNGLLAKAALKLGENLALEQKRLADIASYEQQSAVILSAMRQQGDQQIHILNQLVEAQYNTTDKEEFRALAAHFHRSFETLLSNVRQDNQTSQEATLDKMSRIGLAGFAANISGDREQVLSAAGQGLKSQENSDNLSDGTVASVKGQSVNPLSPSNDEDNNL